MFVGGAGGGGAEDEDARPNILALFRQAMGTRDSPAGSSSGAGGGAGADEDDDRDSATPSGGGGGAGGGGRARDLRSSSAGPDEGAERAGSPSAQREHSTSPSRMLMGAQTAADRSELAMERSLINLPPHIRTALEDRFIEILHDYPCFFDPRDKNFAHNQYKSNSYAEIARKMCAEGLETSGPQLAAIFKGIKAKYRDETRKMVRMEGKIEPSPFFLRLRFLEHGLSTVDQRIAKLRGYVRDTPPSYRRPNTTTVVTPTTSSEIPSTSSSIVNVSNKKFQTSYNTRRVSSATATIITPSRQSVDNPTLQSVVEKLGVDRNVQEPIYRLIASVMTLPADQRVQAVNRLTQACNAFTVFSDAILQLVIPEFSSDDVCLSLRGDVVKQLRTDEKYRALTVNLSDKTLGKPAIADPRLKPEEKELLNLLRNEECIYQHGYMDASNRELLFGSISKQLKPDFPHASAAWVEETFEQLYRKYHEIKKAFAKQKNAVKPVFLKTMSFVERSRLVDSTSPASERSTSVDSALAVDAEETMQEVPRPKKPPMFDASCQTEDLTGHKSQEVLTDLHGVDENIDVVRLVPAPVVSPTEPVEEKKKAEPEPERSPKSRDSADGPPHNPDVQAIVRFFADNQDHLAMFRVLGNAVMNLPESRRFMHLQSLLNITNAANSSPLSVQWKAKVFDPVGGWQLMNQSLTVDGPNPQSDGFVPPLPPTPTLPELQASANGTGAGGGVSSRKRKRDLDDGGYAKVKPELFEEEEDESSPSLGRTSRFESNRENSVDSPEADFRIPPPAGETRAARGRRACKTGRPATRKGRIGRPRKMRTDKP